MPNCKGLPLEGLAVKIANKKFQVERLKKLEQLGLYIAADAIRRGAPQLEKLMQLLPDVTEWQDLSQAQRARVNNTLWRGGKKQV